MDASPRQPGSGAARFPNDVKGRRKENAPNSVLWREPGINKRRRESHTEEKIKHRLRAGAFRLAGARGSSAGRFPGASCRVSEPLSSLLCGWNLSRRVLSCQPAQALGGGWRESDLETHRYSSPQQTPRASACPTAAARQSSLTLEETEAQSTWVPAASPSLSVAEPPPEALGSKPFVQLLLECTERPTVCRSCSH